MKNLLLFIFCLAQIACQSTKNVEDLSTTFSGEFINSNSDKIYLNLGSSTKEIALDGEGNFSIELTGVEEGDYLFHNMEEGGSLYIIPGKDVHLKVDAADFDESLKFSGPGAGPSSYLAENFLTEEKLAKERKKMHSKDETNFSTFNEKSKKESIAILKNYNGLPKHFVKAELANIELQSLVNIQKFINAKGKERINNRYTPSAAFTKTLSALDMDNAEDFDNNSIYNQLVQIRLKSGTVEKVLDRMKNIKSENIRSSIFYGLKSRLKGDSETLDQDYELLLAAAPDDKYKQSLTEIFNKVKFLAKGSPSPEFNFEDKNGKLVQLEKLKGKNVYIDVWATWCGPCKAEIPSLKKLEADYDHDQFEFVSISIDKMKDKGKWLKMIEDKDLGGIQLLADKDYETQFIKDYGIKSIPRFILLDRKGKIVSANAPRPSSGEEIRDLLNTLKM